MIPLVAIGLITIVVASLVLINSTIQDQQELSDINISVQQKNTEIAAETLSIKGMKTDLGSIQFTNSQNEEIQIIQVRVYDDNGDYVESFDVDSIIYGNTKLEVTDFPISLQEMLRDG